MCAYTDEGDGSGLGMGMGRDGGVRALPSPCWGGGNVAWALLAWELFPSGCDDELYRIVEVLVGLCPGRRAARLNPAVRSIIINTAQTEQRPSGTRRPFLS